MVAFDLDLDGDNAVKITCKNQQVYGAETKFVLSWNGQNKSGNHCDFKIQDLSYLTHYDFEVSKHMKLNI